MTILKYLALCLLVNLTYSNTYGQPHVKVFAYEQSVLPGSIPARVTDEQGNPVNTQGAGVSTTFYIYVAHSVSAGVHLSGLWIKGKAFPFAVKTVSTPVVKHLPGNSGVSHPLTMVPRTAMRVSHLVVTGEAPKQSLHSPILKKKLATSEVVVRYRWQGKTYYAVLDNIKVMDPLLHQ